MVTHLYIFNVIVSNISCGSLLYRAISATSVIIIV